MKKRMGMKDLEMSTTGLTCGIWELPCAKAFILIHNIDVMHQECNAVESIISTCMDIIAKQKKMSSPEEI
jgi:hypothetical protein